jgi:hypothetical protein
VRASIFNPGRRLRGFAAARPGDGYFGAGAFTSATLALV